MASRQHSPAHHHTGENRPEPYIRAAPDTPAATAPTPVRLSIVMPAFNEARTIRHAVEHVLETSYPCDVELIVVDDGSSDGTAELLADIDDPRLAVHRHVRNMGKGAAVLTGISVATGTHLLPFDADLEYSAHDVARLLQPIIDGRCDVVYGTRLFGVNTVYRSFRYKVGNQAMTLAANLLFDSALSDLHSCLKLVPLPMLRQMRLVELGFGLDTEITANVLRFGARPFEVPVSYHARSHTDGKKINWRDAVRCMQVLGRVRMAPDPRPADLLAGRAQIRPARRAPRVRQSLARGASLPDAVAVRNGSAATSSGGLVIDLTHEPVHAATPPRRWAEAAE
jgi:dolichol-phosphate hexosyltransferase